MAGRRWNRLELRRQAELAEQFGPISPDKGPTRSRAHKGQSRVCARWGVFDGAMKLVAAFAYNQRAQAEAKVAELNAARTGTYFVQLVKEPLAGPNENDLE
jgi:hypothetical protein